MDSPWRIEEQLRYYERDFDRYQDSKNDFVRIVTQFCIYVISFLREINERLNDNR